MKYLALISIIFFTYTFFKVTLYTNNIYIIITNIVLIAMLVLTMRYSHSKKQKQSKLWK